MNDVKGVPAQTSTHEFSAGQLIKTIFKADSPEQYVRSFAPQSLYVAIKHVGLESATDLLSIATLEQCRVILDLDLWSKDELNEEELWQWLALTDEDDSLELLQKIVKCIDLKIVALLIARHVQVVIFDERTEQPPAPGFYTPDQGMSWLGITIEDPTRHRLLGKLLALIFETSIELFYQLLAIPQTHTITVLEEESLQDRQKRLSAEGIPDSEYAYSLQAPITRKALEEQLESKSAPVIVTDIHPVEPLIYQSTTLHPFRELLHDAAGSDTFQAELTLLMNGAIVAYNIDFSSSDEVTLLTQKVRGAINIGLELLKESSSLSISEIYRSIGLTSLYRLGLTSILTLRHQLKKLREENFTDTKLLTLQMVRARFPEFPEALQEDGSFAADNEGKISSSPKPFEHRWEIEMVRRILG